MNTIKSQPWHDAARLLAQHDPPLSYTEIGKRSGINVSASMVSNFYKREGISKPPEPRTVGTNSFLYGGKPK